MTMNINFLKNLTLLLAVFVLVGCISKEQNAPKLHIVKILQMKFQPEELWVNKQDTVVFINEDMVAHDVIESTNSKWASSRLEAGNSWKLVVTETSDYYCNLHKVMKGKILVRVE